MTLMGTVGLMVVLMETDGSVSAAAWVQAIGSIVAILAAAWIANRQSVEAMQRDTAARSHSENIRLARLASFRSSARSLIQLAAIRVRAIADGLEQDGKDRVGSYSEETVRSLVSRLGKFPIETLEDPNAVFYFEQAESGLHIFSIHLRNRRESATGSLDADFRRGVISELALEAKQQADELDQILVGFNEACSP